jgi:hypothetical protein
VPEPPKAAPARAKIPSILPAGPAAGSTGTVLPLPDNLQAPILAAIAASPDVVLGAIGAPMKEHLAAAQSMLEALPDPLKEAAREPFGARALVYALLLDDEEDVRSRQLARLEQHADEAVLKTTHELLPLVQGVARELRLPLLDLSMPALRSLSPEQAKAFGDNVRQLVEADESISLFEYALQHTLVKQLKAGHGKPRRRAVQIYALKGVASECSRVLSLLARVGADDEAAAAAAFRHAVQHFREPGVALELVPKEQSSLRDLDNDLDRLAVVSTKVKKWLLVGCVQCLVHDRKITVDEAGLFRAIASSLDCPVPPWLTAAAQPLPE